MRLVDRWGVAVVVSAAGSALAWWICAKLIGLDEGVSPGEARAVVAVLVAVAAWWLRGAPTAKEQTAAVGGWCRRPGRAAMST